LAEREEHRAVPALLVCAGLALVVVVLVDVVWTAAAAGSGAGPLSGRLSALLWRGALAAGRSADGPRHRLLTVAGIGVVVVVVLFWAATAWLAWWLVFSAADGAVLDAASKAPASLVERAQFAGAAFFTLGSDELTTGSGAWQFAPIGATATGVVFVTVAISYFVPVAAALAERRQLAAYISSLGQSPEDLVVNGWTNDSFRALEQHLVALTPLVHSLAERDLTYPVLQYFHSGRRERTSTALSLAVLDEAVLLLRAGVAAGARPDPATLQPLVRAVGWYLDTVEGALVASAGSPLPAPDLQALRGAGIPTVDDDEFRAALDGCTGRRCQLTALLVDEGWTAESWARRRRRLRTDGTLRRAGSSAT
jgi:hypothetical protein